MLIDYLKNYLNTRYQPKTSLLLTSHRNLKRKEVVKAKTKMKNVDIEVYISNLINFFEKNPNDLLVLIGDLQKDEFYVKLKERAISNFEKGQDYILTKSQIVDVVLELKLPIIKEEKKPYIEKIIQRTKFGDIILN
jgi:hypothetical protein